MSKKEEPELILATSPFLKYQEDMPFIMRQVIYSLVPVVIVSAYFFGIGALFIILASVLGCVIPEYFLAQGERRGESLKDGSAVITGILLGLTLPPTIPLWMAFLGGVVAIVLGKLLFGGIGHNVFNPALVGRAFLQAAFPTAITTWATCYPGKFFIVPKSVFAFPFTKGEFITGKVTNWIHFPSFQPVVDTLTGGTPLGKMKFDLVPTQYLDLFLGNISGSLGETCALVILIGGIYLALRNCLNWRIPVSIFLGVFIFAGILHFFNPAKYPPPLFHFLSGGLMLGAIFMATDMVTSPVTPLGCWIFGIGIGILVVLIRIFGGLPEGVMYAILLMNGVTPLIDRITQPKIYGNTGEKK